MRLRSLLPVFMIFFLSSAYAEDQVLDRFLPAGAALPALHPWQPETPVSPPAGWTKTPSGENYSRLDCPFSVLKEWRVYWDKRIKADLSSADQIVVEMRCPVPDAVNTIIMYFEAGNGWYSLPTFGLSSNWTPVILRRDDSQTEGSPSGWNNVDRIRISVLPGRPVDTYVEIRSISARQGWPLSMMGSVGQFTNFAQAVACLTKAAEGLDSRDEVLVRLAEASKIARSVAKTRDTGKKEIQAKILKVRELTAQAYALVQKPVENEFRGFWCHSGDGVSGYNGRSLRWKEAIPMIRKYGFNAIFPNVLWSGIAYYPSKVVPTAPGVAAEGDYLQEIIDAAKPLGIAVHPWKVMWQFGWMADPSAIEPFRKENRLQVDSSGKQTDWLCPSDPRNRQYELDAIKELARYEIQGIHLDYIRYSGEDVCFCGGCRVRFEKKTGKPVKNWPADVLITGPRGEEYGQWKRDVITSFVKECRDMIKTIRPMLKLSAAVFDSPEGAKRSVFQDWGLWAEKGYLDFVCTMTYTPDPVNFRNKVLAQAETVKGKIPLYPGMMVFYENNKPISTDAMVDEILTTRTVSGGGFMFFELRDFLQDTILPYLAAGLTRTDGYKLSFREIPAEQLPSVVVKGVRLKPKGKSLLIDNFEDADLVSALGVRWSAECDRNSLGTVLNPSPLVVASPGTNGCIRIWGHYGFSRAPWPYAQLMTWFLPSRAAADLGAFSAIEFDARGNGKTYEVCLDKKAVKDYAHFKSSFTAPADGWVKVVLPFDGFTQPSWGKAEEKVFSDVTGMYFRPGDMNDEDFDLSIDNIRLVK